ncbi:transcription termination factor MTERF4, chloroplastic-like [Phragmites australis]|uniref:transcription termination factor MTERF4, chloroplastic-like n=1 Tax=Phragmites australis TaxID=29695 RepID=UPI002D774390|nr:transcription termination factor MTERF4, chloroplastic-like [Phragmites australis]
MTHHLRVRVLSLLLHTPSHPPASRISPHRLLSTAAPTSAEPFAVEDRLLSTAAPTSPKPFAVEDYLVASCGLTRAQALKASRYLSHLKSPSNSDAVLAFLSGLGLPRSDITTVVAIDPRFLCASVERTLTPQVAELGYLGLSRPQIARLVPLALSSFRISSLGRNLSFWLSVFDGSFETLLQVLRYNCGILRVGIEKVAMPNLAFLQQCGINISEVAVMNMYSSRLFTLKPKSLREAAERVEELGVKRGSRMFPRALALVAFMSKEDVARKIGLLQKIGFSQDDALVIVRKAPPVLRLTEEKIKRAMNFLTTDVGLEAPYIAERPALFMYSLERRLLPRHFLLKVLREKGLLNIEFDYYYTASMAENIFLQKFVHPYKDHVPGLTDDYASRCSGKAAGQEV